MSKNSNPELRKMKLPLNNDFKEETLGKIHYFTNNTNSVPWISQDFENTIIASIDLQWQNTHREPAPPTEIGVATIRGLDFINAIRAIDAGGNPAQILIKLFSTIKASHVRPLEFAHQVNRGHWLQDQAEENFKFGTTGFLPEAESKKFVTNIMTESYWQKENNTTDRRPIIIVGQGFYSDSKILKASYQLDPHKTDIVDIFQAKNIAKDIGVPTGQLSL
jgi:hypothetical protein